MALYHNLSSSKGNFRGFCSSPFLLALSHPQLFVSPSPPFSSHLTFVQRLQEKRQGKKMQLQVGSPLAQLWERCHTGAFASQGGDSLATSCATGAQKLWFVLLQGQHSIQTHSAVANCKSAAKSAPLTSVTPVTEQLLVVFWVGFQGWFFFPPRKTVTCNYTAVQITAKAGIRKHRKAVTVYNGEIRFISELQNTEENTSHNRRPKRTDSEAVLLKKKILLPTTHVSTAMQHFIIKKSFPGTYSSKGVQVGEGFCRVDRSHVRRMCSTRS